MHPKNKGLYKPHLLRLQNLSNFDSAQKHQFLTCGKLFRVFLISFLALSILLFPQMIGTFLTRFDNQIIAKISSVLVSFTQTSLPYAILYFILVFLFTYFYTAVTFDPEALSTNLQKNGAFVPGIRPGASTSEYISKVLSRITFLGATFLGFIAVLPLIMQFATGNPSFALGGTSVLIVVSVVLDLIKKVDAQISMREY